MSLGENLPTQDLEQLQLLDAMIRGICDGLREADASKLKDAPELSAVNIDAAPLASTAPFADALGGDLYAALDNGGAWGEVLTA